MRAPSFTPGVKDYAEIFNCSSSKPSSIPVLELDEFHEREVGDVVMVDYGNVFGGFNDAKIGLGYEDVFSVASNGVSRYGFYLLFCMFWLVCLLLENR